MVKFFRWCVVVGLTLPGLISCGDSTGPGDEPAIKVKGSGNGAGTISIAPGDLSCSVPASKSCTKTFDLGQAVTLTAVADPGSSFMGWNGAGCTGLGSCTIQVDVKKVYTVAAEFAEGSVLSILPQGTGSGTITSNPAGISCVVVAGSTSGTGCIHTFPLNTQVQLAAVPSGGGSMLLNWGGEGVACPGRGLCSVLMDRPRSVEAGLYVPFYADKLTTGYYHTCALVDSIAYCWGDNSLGQLGIGNTGGWRTRPSPVATTLRFVEISSQIFHTCALTAGGATYCWGANDYGQLGTGDTLGRSDPTRVQGAPTFTTISVGRGQSCGLIADGHAYCWGRNDVGEMGDGTFGPPVLSPSLAGGGMTFSAISPGEAHTCGLSAGTAYCWGNNYVGELGNGTDNTTSQVPVPVSGGPFTKVQAGYFGSCGLSNAHLYCWGGGWNYAFGNNSTATFNIPTQAANGAFLLDFSYVSLHGCGIGVGFNPMCWGDNLYGAIGDGTTVNAPLPTGVHGGIGVSYLSANRYQTCALTTDQIVYCWGWNVYGGLGTGDLVDRTEPAPVIP